MNTNPTAPEQEKNSYKKRFPSDITMEKKTFFNDKKIDAEIYAYMMHYSIVKYVNGEPRTYCPYPRCSKKALEEFFGYSQPKIRTRIKYLEDRKYIERESDNQRTGYFLNNPESFFIDIPADTLDYMIQIFKEDVVKVYLYLGVKQKWCQKTYQKNYNFTKKEIIEHCGLKYGKDHKEYRVLEDILSTLDEIGLCSVQEITIIGLPYPKLEVVFWTDKKEKRKISKDPIPRDPSSTEFAF